MKKAGIGCLIAFATPFAAVGIYGTAIAIKLASQGAPRTAVFLMACAALAFGGVGFGLIAATLWGSSRVKADDALRARHPDEPWMWNAEWASRRIRDHSRMKTVGLWGFALLWNAVASPVLVFLPQELEKGNHLAWFGLLFPIAGMGLIIAAVWSTLRALRFRDSTLVLDTLPAPIGGALRGTIEVPHESLADATSAMVRLDAVVRTGSGKSRTETTTTHEDCEIAPAAIRRTPDGVAIPIEIPVPADASPTDDQRTWRVVIDAEVPGVDYRATFDVPVFRTAFADFRPHAAPSAPMTTPLNPRSYVEREGADGHEIHFPAFRAPSIALWTLLFAVLWIGALVFAITLGAPIAIPIIMGLIAVPVLRSTLDLFFTSRTVILGGDRVTVRRRALFTSEQTIPRGEIESVRAVVAARNDSRPYYHIDIRTKSGKRVRAARYVSRKREAEWAASRIGRP